MLRVKRQVEPECEQPEMPEAQSPARHAAERLRIPVVDPRKNREEQATNQHIVEVRHHEIRVRQLPVERRHGHHDAGQTGDQELREEAEAEHHR